MKILKTTGKIVLGIIVGIGLLFGLFYLLTIGEYEVAKTVAQDPSIPHVIIDGVTYHTETFGDSVNPVVITVHGGPGGDYRSIRSLRGLSDDYFVVFFDQRGTGLSPRVDPGEITLESAIDDLDSIVDYYGGADKVNLIGHSWGAMLVTAYLGRYPDKVERAVLAEPGFLTSDMAKEFFEKTRPQLSFSMLYYFLKTKFQALHVRRPDVYASGDYFSHQWNMYPGSDHPQGGYRCDGVGPEDGEYWRNGADAASSIMQAAMDSDGIFNLDLTQGVENFPNQVLFIAGECQTIIGVDWQKRMMPFFRDAELAVIPDAGHEMFSENPQASVNAVREYLNSPAQ
jgi:proline iminopeptidase